MSISELIRRRLDEDKVRYWANDNISKYIGDDERQKLIDEVAEKFESVLDSLLIDRFNDPNSMDTGRRLAKMYINELMSGRYNPIPNATEFPNHVENGYKGMLVVRSEIKSVCSHHHQPVSGVAYIGIIAAEQLIGLSKYTRIAQWCARRGTLQEELNNVIADEIQKATGSSNVGVYLQATHGCCENRGIGAHSSLTQTTVLRGAFTEDMGTKKEFMDNIKLQQEFAPRQELMTSVDDRDVDHTFENEQSTVTIPLKEYDKLRERQKYITDRDMIAVIDKIEELVRALRKHIVRADFE